METDFALLDEIDSGLDIDALKVVSKGINAMRGQGFGAMIITHYQRLLNYITPDVVHVDDGSDVLFFQADQNLAYSSWKMKVTYKESLPNLALTTKKSEIDDVRSTIVVGDTRMLDIKRSRHQIMTKESVLNFSQAEAETVWLTEHAEAAFDQYPIIDLPVVERVKFHRWNLGR